MRNRLIAEFERIAGSRLTPELRAEMADKAVKVIEDFQRAAALAAIEQVKTSVIKEGVLANEKENGHKKP